MIITALLLFTQAADALVLGPSREGLDGESFEAFVQQYGRTYPPGGEEYAARREVFEANLAEIQAQNAKPNRKWTARMNEFGDHHDHEIPRGYLNNLPKGPSRAPRFLRERPRKRPPQPLPEIHEEWMDLWTSKRSGIKKQDCGNCWAAATASMLEAHLWIHRGIKKRVSYMELTNCTDNTFNCGGTGGCHGSTVELAIHQVMRNGMREEAKLNTCPANQRPIEDPNERAPHEWGVGVRHAGPLDRGLEQFGITGWERLPENEYEPLARALVERGPVGVAISTRWWNYGWGIFDSCDRDTVLGHLMLLVGYGYDRGAATKYWRVQNSWGAQWGEDGFMRLQRHDDEEAYCGTDDKPQHGSGCDAGPQEITVCGSCGILYDAVVPHFNGTTDRSLELARLRGEV